MRRLLLVLPLLIFISLMSIPYVAVFADCTWSQIFDFTTSDYSSFTFSGRVGSYVGGVGWQSEDDPIDGRYSDLIKLLTLSYPSGHIASTITYEEIHISSPGGWDPVPGGFIAVTIPSNATGDQTYTWTETAPGDFTIPSGAWSAQYGANIGGHQNDHRHNLWTYWRIDGTGYDPFTATDCGAGAPTAAFTFDPPGGGTSPLGVDFTDTSSDNGDAITAWAWDFDDAGATSSSQNPSHTFTDPGDYDVSLTVTNPEGSDTIHHTVSVIPPTGTPGGELYKPLTDADINHHYYDGIFDTSDIDLLNRPTLYDIDPALTVATSNTPGNDVYAVADGTVISVAAPGKFTCANAGLSDFLLGGCIFAFNAHGNVNPSIAGVDYYRIDISNAYLVTLTFGDTEEIQYLVAGAQEYVYPGLTLHAGCIVGKTLTLGGVLGSISLPGISFSSPFPDIGVTFLQLFPDYTLTPPLESLFPNLTVSVDPGKACNADPEFATCMGADPHFRNGGWTISAGSAFFGDAGGVYLNPGAEVSMEMNLDPEVEYTLTAAGIQTASPGSLFLRIGTASQSLNVDNTTERVALESVSPAGALGDGFYEIGLKNTGNFLIYVDYACVSAGASPTNPTVCYFANNSFDQDGQHWTAGGNIFFPGDGTAVMADASDGTLSQAVNLPAGDYILSASVRAYFNVALSEITSPAANVTLHYTLAGGSEQDFTTYDFSGAFPVFNVITSSFTLSDTTSGNMIFYLDINSGSAELQGLNITSFCLQKEGGNPPPTTGTPPASIPSNCEVIANPITTDVPSWINWQWAQFNRFFTCTLTVLLNKMLAGINSGITFMRWQMLYWQTYIRGATIWINNNLIPWLAGHLANIAQGRTTTIVQVGGTDCHDIFCVITSGFTQVITPLFNIAQTILNTVIGYLNIAVSLLLSAIQLILSIFTFLATQFFNLFNTLTSTISQLISGWQNATPTAIPGLPECQIDPKSSFPCMIFWVMDNTIFSGRGALIIPLLIGIASVHLLLWTIGIFRRELTHAAEAS